MLQKFKLIILCIAVGILKYYKLILNPISSERIVSRSVHVYSYNSQVPSKFSLDSLFANKLFGKKCPDKYILLNLYILCNKHNNIAILPEKEVFAIL